MDDAYVSEHFTREELACHCGCGWMGVPPHMIQTLERVRAGCGFPLPILSACRCPSHDKAVGGKGAHTTGLAFDPSGIRGAHGHTLLKVALFHGATGVGVGSDGSVRHLDWIEPGGSFPRGRLWTYGRGY